MRLLTAGLALLAATLAFSCASTPASNIAAGAEKAPDFSVTDQNNRVWTVADSASKPLLIDLWATWCAPCLQALPDLKRFAQAHGNRMNVLGVAMDQQGWPVVTPVLKRYALNYPVAVAAPSFSASFGVPAYPYLVLVQHGSVVKRLKGRHSYADLEKELAAWLK